MKLSLNWIQDFVQLPNLSPKELATRFTLGTAEVEEVIEEGLFWRSLRVAEVLSVNKHPEADKLNLVTFSLGDEQRQVVCGASNVRVGLKTVFAPTGVTLPIGLTLEPKKIRGVLSEGMLCSEEELALANESEGIIELPADAPVGQAMNEYWQKSSDIILDVDNKSLTHRPDLWGHLGLAREFAALFERPLNIPYSAEWMNKMQGLQNTEKSPMTIHMKGDSAGIGYFGLSVDGVQVTNSPNWMQERLTAVGLRPINSIVDISNYVMLELGIPLHIFDREKIQGDQVVIHELTEESSFRTLDEVERTLVPGDTVIADQRGPLVLAGIMGGLESGVSEATTKIFIEVANWKASRVRQTSTRLGLRTDSSQRYEKTLDSQLLERTLWRTLELVLKFNPNAKVVGRLEYDGVDLSNSKGLELQLNVDKARRTLGLSESQLSNQHIQTILERLDFRCSPEGHNLKVAVPSYRATKDIECEADLVEELGRVVGYDHVLPQAPSLPIAPTRLSLTQELHRKLRDFMVLHGEALEVMTYPLVGKKLLERALWPELDQLVLNNALSQDHNQMRPSLIPSLIEAVSKNAKHFDECTFFELGRRYLPSTKSFSEEENHLALVSYHHKKTPFLRVLNKAERLLRASNIPYDLALLNLAEGQPKERHSLVDWSWPGLHPYEVTSVRVMGKHQGLVFSLHPLVMRQFKIKGHVSVFLLNLAPIEARPLKDKTKYQPLAKFPGSFFDCTVVTDQTTAVQSILDALKPLKNMKELQRTQVVDVFLLNDSEKAVTLRTEFLDQEKTLSGEFLTAAQNQLVETLRVAGFPLKA